MSAVFPVILERLLRFADQFPNEISCYLRQSGTGALPEHARHWAACTIRAGPAPITVGMGEVAAIRTMTTELGDAASETGDGHARYLAVRYLTIDVQRWLDGKYTDPVGRELFAATSQLIQLIGWIAVTKASTAWATSRTSVGTPPRPWGLGTSSSTARMGCSPYASKTASAISRPASRACQTIRRARASRNDSHCERDDAEATAQPRPPGSHAARVPGPLDQGLSSPSPTVPDVLSLHRLTRREGWHATASVELGAHPLHLFFVSLPSPSKNPSRPYALPHLTIQHTCRLVIRSHRHPPCAAEVVRFPYSCLVGCQWRPPECIPSPGPGLHRRNDAVSAERRAIARAGDGAATRL